jgi:two-component system phosphate regulon response regulator PhoB
VHDIILVVEDETDLAATVEYNLSREGFSPRVAHTGQEAIAACAREPMPDAILLDLMLPDISGTEVFRRLRDNERTRHIPVLMCTARGDETDRIVGLELGAEDYIVKPFAIRELMLRVRSVLRRFRGTEPEPTSLRYGRLRVDREAHRAWNGESELELTALEFKLLSELLLRRGRVHTRDSLLASVWGIEGDVETRTVDTHVKRLREKLGDLADYIQTLRGVGYRMREQPGDE